MMMMMTIIFIVVVAVDRGDNETEALAHEFGATTVTIGNYSEWKKPFVREIFDTARLMATTPYIMFVNGDIVLTQEVIDAIHHVHARVSVGRYDDLCGNPDLFARRDEVEYEREWQKRKQEAQRFHRLVSRSHASSDRAMQLAEEKLKWVANVTESQAEYWDLPAMIMTGRRWSFDTDKVGLSKESLLEHLSQGNWTDHLTRVVMEGASGLLFQKVKVRSLL